MIDQQDNRPATPGPILLSSNSLWNIVNFRSQIVNRLAADGHEVIVAAPATVEERATFALPATIEKLSIDRSGFNPVRDGRLVARYRRLFRTLRPAAYLGWTIKPNIYGALAARFAGVHAILNVSGLGTAFLRGGLLSRFVGLLYRVAFRSAHVVFFQNADDRALFLTRRLVRPGQARLLPGSGIDLDHFHRTSIPDGPPAFLLIARLLGDKGVREYVEAAKRVRVEHSDAIFRLLGPLDPNNRSAVTRDELDGWIVDGTVHYLGNTDDVRPAIAAASVIVLPSYREGLPRTLLEGAAMGRPLIATDVPGCRDVVESGVNGLLCEARNAGSLADAMLAMVRLEADQRAAMGAKSRVMVERHFGQDRVTGAYLQALREVGIGSS